MTTTTLLALALLAPPSNYDQAKIAAAPKIPVPAGMGRYCSLTYASGGWAFQAAGRDDDPCATMLASSPGGTIRRAGLYSLSAENNVVLRCDDGIVTTYGEKGRTPIDAAVAKAQGRKGCVITASPKVMRIFDAPFAAKPSATFFRGIDFAWTANVVDNGGTSRSAVDYKGRHVPEADGHDGIDWPMPRGTEVKAVAAGIVLERRRRDVTRYIENGCPKGDSHLQHEVYVLHVVGQGVYAELFVSYYAHVGEFHVNPGEVVARGEVIAKSGHTGCSGAPHLHLEVGRFSNTNVGHRHSVKVPATEDYDQRAHIDPYGFSWAARAGFDPWSWQAIGQNLGALSIELWRDGQRPVRP